MGICTILYISFVLESKQHRCEHILIGKLDDLFGRTAPPIQHRESSANSVEYSEIKPRICCSYINPDRPTAYDIHHFWVVARSFGFKITRQVFFPNLLECRGSRVLAINPIPVRCCVCLRAPDV